MASMSRPKQHHYLPQSYLGFFEAPSKPGHIFFYRRGEEVLMTNIKKVAREGYLYAFKDEHGNYNFELENLLGQIEGPTKPILEKLNHCDGPVSITAEQKEILSSFVTFQAIRTPAYMNSLQGAYTDFAKLISQVCASNKGWFERSVQSAREAGVDLPEDLDVESIREFALQSTGYPQAVIVWLTL